MQLCVLFSTSLLPILLNYCRPVVDIILLDEFQFGVQGQSPGGGLGAKPPEAELFHFRKVIVALKRGEAANISGRF